MAKERKNAVRRAIGTCEKKGKAASCSKMKKREFSTPPKMEKKRGKITQGGS